MATQDKRILYIIDSLNLGGAETLLMELVAAFRKRDARVHVAYFTPGPLLDDLKALGVSATRLSDRGLKHPKVVLAAYRLMREFRPDIVHTHLTKSDLIGQPLAWIFGVKRRIVTLHNTDPWRQRRMLSGIYRLFTAGAHAHVAVSERVAEHSVETLSVPKTSTVVIPNGVDVMRFDRNAVSPLLLSRWGVPAGAQIVSIIGRLTAQKDHGTFLEAARALTRRFPDAYFLIVGAGERQDEIAAEIARMGPGSERIIMTGLIRDIPALLAATDIVVFSSAWEGLPMVLLEALAMECPVVSTDVGGISRVIENGRNGSLVTARSPACLADAIAHLLEDPETRKSYQEHARATILDAYSSTAMIGRLAALYEPDGDPMQFDPVCEYP